MRTADARILVIIISLLASAATSASAQTGNPGAPARVGEAEPALVDAAPTPQSPVHLRVAVAGSKPFVVRSTDEVQGLSIDVWKAIALQLKVTFTLTPYDRVADAIAAVKAGEMDVAIGPISITRKRAELVEFTQPYFTASAGILAQSKPGSAWTRFKPLMSKAFLIGITLMIVVLFLVGNLVWVAERRTNHEAFPRAYGPGVLTGMWFAIVTMTTVGYGDKTPKSAAGRAVASVWMLVALLAMSSVTAGIATAFTLSQIETPGISDMASLSNRRVVVVKGTPGETLVRRYRAKIETETSKAVALQRVASGEVEAMIYDYPVLKYYLHENPRLKLSAIQTSILSDNYGFAVPRKSPLVAQMNLALLNLRETGKVLEIAQQWMVAE